MKKLSVLVVIYFLALGLSFFGFILDSDTKNYQNQMAYVLLVSLVVFGLLTGIVFLLYAVFVYCKVILEKKQLIN